MGTFYQTHGAVCYTCDVMFTMALLKLGGALFSIFASACVVDWIFSGSKWAHTYFAAHPEIWRPMKSENKEYEEGRVVRLTMLVTLEFAVAFIAAFFLLSPGILFSSTLLRASVVSIGLWLVVAVPMAITQHLFIKYHRMSTILMLAGWLIKLFIASLIMSWLF